MNNKECFKCFLDESSLLLDTYKGRDKILRTICYLTKLLAEGQKDPSVSKKLLALSSQMSATRSTLRLLDDVSVIKNSIEFGLGGNEPDNVMAFLGVVTNLIDHAFLVTEKVSWLAKYKVIEGVDKSKWDNTSTFCWALSSYLAMIKTLRYLMAMQRHKDCVPKDKSIPIEKLKAMKKFQLMTLARQSLDFTHAVSILPPGFLWSSRLKGWHVGMVGTASSILGLYLIFYKKWWLK